MNATDRLRIKRSDLASLLGRAIARLGEATQDRLLSIPVQDIVERAWILDPPPLHFNNQTGPRMDLMSLRPVQLPQSSIAILSEIQESPSKAELGDLGFIDAFFSPVGEGARTPSGTPIRHMSRFQELICTAAVRWPPPYEPGGYAIVRTNPTRQILPPGQRGQDDPFFCTPQAAIDRSMVIDLYYGGPSEYFGLDLSKPWRELRPILLNIENLLKLIGGSVYAWPAPARITVYWWELAQSGLRELVRQPGILTQDAARLWVTLSLLTHYNELVAFARAEMEKSARSERFAMIILTVALVAFGLVLSVAFGPLIAAGFKAASGALTEAAKRDAAKDLNAAAKELQTSDPGFAGEVQWSAQYIQQMLNEASRPAGTSAPGQGGALEAVVGIGLPTLISVGISILGKR